MTKKTTKDLLPQHWVHSHEEDTDAEKVYRPSSYHFPPSRGRQSFELKPDGTLVEHGPGPTDRPQESPGSWKLEGDDTLAFFAKKSSEPSKKMKIASLDENRLVVKK
jgi:hypothetical protein